jgi:lipopolysaccharide transport system ATP-binding protein
MLTRLGFSVVAHLEPEILLVDEVLAVGDVGFLQKSMQRMLEFKNSGVTMVFVSHAMGDIRDICDRVIWIENHMIKMQGDPDSVCEAYSETMMNKK